VSLNAVGHRQAAALARRLADEPIDAIYASDLQRAWQTAEAVAAHHDLPVHRDPRLRELHFGIWEGLTYAEIEAQDPEALAAWREDPLNVAPPEGETLAELAQRVAALRADLEAAHPEETALLVSHNGVLRVLICQALGLPPENYWQFHMSNASLSDLAFYEAGAILNALNETAHLEEEETVSRREGDFVLVLGGARSGKSRFAQDLALERGGEQVLFVATAEAGDDEMAVRIDRHRRERPAGWRTLEAPRDMAEALPEQIEDAQVVLLDCLTVLISNLVLEAEEDPFAPDVEGRIIGEIEAIADVAARFPGTFVVVSNEAGMGVVPPYPLGRAFRDLQGRANQILARYADAVYLLVAGVPLRLKGD
jgi:adenosylcobinamide kinase/adenosylcobinamide-phosphate guanylyltransferase